MRAFLLLALLHTTALGAESSLIVLPSTATVSEKASSKHCRIWMLPPAAIERSVRDGLTSIASALMSKPELAQAATLTLQLLEGRTLSAVVVDNPDAPFAIELAGDGSPRVKISVETAATLVELSNPDRQSFALVRTTVDVAPALSRAWLEALANASFKLKPELGLEAGEVTLWQRLARPREWLAAWEGAPKPTEKEIALAVWARVSKLHESGELGRIAEALVAAHASPPALGEIEILVALQSGQYRALFSELGRRASLATTRELYLQLYYQLAREFDPAASSLIIIKRMPGVF